MPQLLLELFSEEIPARMQAGAARDLERLAREKLAAEGLLPEALTTFAGPRRLTLVAEGLAAAQPERHEERKGPRVGAPAHCGTPRSRRPAPCCNRSGCNRAPLRAILAHVVHHKQAR